MVVDDVDGPLGGEHLLHRLHVHLARAHQRAVPRTVVQVNQHACKEKSGLLSHLHKGCLILPQRKGRLRGPIGPLLGGARVPGCRSCLCNCCNHFVTRTNLSHIKATIDHKLGSFLEHRTGMSGMIIANIHSQVKKCGID